MAPEPAGLTATKPLQVSIFWYPQRRRPTARAWAISKAPRNLSVFLYCLSSEIYSVMKLSSFNLI